MDALGKAMHRPQRHQSVLSCKEDLGVVRGPHQWSYELSGDSLKPASVRSCELCLGIAACDQQDIKLACAVKMDNCILTISDNLHASIIPQM